MTPNPPRPIGNLKILSVVALFFLFYPAFLAPVVAHPQAQTKESDLKKSNATPAKDTEHTNPASAGDILETYTAPVSGYDYDKRVVMIPMRDGVKLFTVIVVPKGAKNAPILLTRTPYNAAKRTARMDSPHMLSILPQGDEVFVADKYIRVFQDVRGKYGSEGDYVMTRPVRGPLNKTETDHVTDTYDTIDWLVKNIPESNGRVGMIGSSYEGFTVVMGLLAPHPALKVAAPEPHGIRMDGR